MCGVIGILLADHKASVAQDLYDGLTLLQHRGQDAAGIATCGGSKIHLHKAKGLVRDVFSVDSMVNLRGAYGVGHVRYPTTGCNSVEEAQPFLSNIPMGFCVSHNGHLTNANHLRDQLSAGRHFNTDSDTELLSELFRLELSARHGGAAAPTADMLFDIVQAVMSRCRGGYAVTLVLHGLGVLAFRDPHGIRPLCLGARRSEGAAGKMDLAAASESAAVTGLGFSLKRDIAPGEAVFLDARTSSISARVCLPRTRARTRFSPCIFEYVYMARPDSILDGVSVYAARAAMGRHLADKVKRELSLSDSNVLLDVVVPVPETSRIAAMHCANKLGLPYEEGLTKNRYIGRTFIMPGQSVRQLNVRKKLSVVRHVVTGKRVLLVDDSIVRGTTSRQIVRLVREAGARSVYFCSASPPVRYPNCYGIDLPSQSELVAFGLGERDIAEAVGADGVVFQDLDDLEDAVSSLNPTLAEDGFENSMFTGDYVTTDDSPFPSGEPRPLAAAASLSGPGMGTGPGPGSEGAGGGWRGGPGGGDGSDPSRGSSSQGSGGATVIDII